MQMLTIPLQEVCAAAAMCLLRKYCGLEVDRCARHDTRVSFKDSSRVIVNIRIFSSARNQFDYAYILFGICSFRLCCRLAIPHPVKPAFRRRFTDHTIFCTPAYKQQDTGHQRQRQTCVPRDVRNLSWAGGTISNKLVHLCLVGCPARSDRPARLAHVAISN